MRALYHPSLLLALPLLFSTSFHSVANDSNSSESSGQHLVLPHNALTAQEKANGWMLLFDGESTSGWHTYHQPDGIPSWKVENGVLSVDPGASGVQHGDLATDQEYENYELQFDWKSPESGNSGVFINVQEDADNLIAWHTGPEYQLLGTAHKDNEDATKQTGDIFGYISEQSAAKVRGDGQWNRSRIRQVNGKLEFYLNGSLTANVDFNSEAWQDWLTQSRFKDYPRFGTFTKGHIVLQEWTSPIYFRNIKIREL